MFDLKGHVAVVTGGNAGLGLAMARGLAKAGATIAVWGRTAGRNSDAVSALEALGADAAAFEVDVTDRDACARAFGQTVERFGRVDSFFANAGGSGVRGPFHKLSAEDWQTSIDLNLGSVISCFQLAVGHWLEMRQPGRLVVTSSIAGILGIPMGSGYSATKAAVQGLVRALAIEYGRAGIVANAILPGFIETEMSLNTPQAFQDGCRRRAASGEIGRLEDMEGIAVFLAAPESRFLTGQCLVLDGGHTIFPL